MAFDQIKRLADARQHPKRQHIDLEDTQAVDIILVPWDHRAVVHRGVFHRHQFIQAPLGDDEAPDMLRQVAGKALNFLNQFHRLAQAFVGRVKPDLAQAGIFHPLHAAKAPDLRRHRRQCILGQPHRPADLAHRPLAAIMDHRGTETGAVAAIAFVDMLDHLLAPLMLEIDINVGRFVARLGHEPFKHHGADFGRNRGDAQRIAHHRIGGRTAPLTQDTARAGKGHDIMDGQEIGLIPQLADQRQFMRHHGADPVGRALRIAPVEPGHGQPRQPFGRGLIAGEFRGIFVFQLIQTEGQPGGDVARPVHRRLMAAKQPQHLGLRAQAAFGIGLRPAAKLFDLHAKPDRGQHIGQLAALGVVHQRGG